MFLPCSLIKLVKAVDYFSSSSAVHFPQNVTFSSISKSTLIGYYSYLVANHMVYTPHVALRVFGPALVHLREVRREQHLAEAGGEQMAPEDTCRRC